MGKKGRNRRDRKSTRLNSSHRYYYWTEVRRLRFDDAVKEMSEHEFFLSEFMIWQILKKSSASNTPEEFKVIRKHKIPKVEDAQLLLFTDEEKP